MSVIDYRANLSAKVFPFLTDFQGQTVIVPGQDNTFNRSLTSTEDIDRDVGIPQLYYCHNVLPEGYGFASIGYDLQIQAYSTPSTQFNECQVCRANYTAANTPGVNFLFSPTPSGTHYFYKLGSVNWAPIATVVPYAATKAITYGLYQNITYIFFEGIGLYKYDTASNTLVAVAMTGLTVANIKGIVAAAGYLLAYDGDHVYWNSIVDVDYTLNSIDYTPSLITDASSEGVGGLKGIIKASLPAPFGMIIYSDTNAVSGIASGNPRFPFSFNEIVNSGGIATINNVAYDASTANQYAYTTNGFQALAATTASTIFPELTDFLGGANFEDFDEASLTFSQQALVAPLLKKIVAVSGRYLVMSYGITELTHAIVFDMAQKRYGKLKITHTDCFEFKYLDTTQADAPRRSIAFLKKDGSVYTVNPTVTLATSRGVLLLGKYQYVRSRLLQLEGVILQSIYGTQSISVYDYPSMTGGPIGSLTPQSLFETTVAGDAQKIYKCRITAKNHSLLLIGGFSLSSIALSFNIGGHW